MAIEDIIKGVAYPLRYFGVLLLVLIAYFALSLIVYDVASSKLLSKGRKARLIIFTVAAILSLCSYLATYYSNTDKIPEWLQYPFSFNIRPLLFFGLGLAFTATTLMVTSYQASNIIYRLRKANARMLGQSFRELPLSVTFMNFAILFSLSFLFISSIISGQIDAKDILLGREFNYVMRQTLPNDIKIKLNRPYLILLGSFSNKYVFVDSEHNEHFFIDKDDMHAVQVRRFDSSDSILVARFNRELFNTGTNKMTLFYKPVKRMHRKRAKCILRRRK